MTSSSYCHPQVEELTSPVWLSSALASLTRKLSIRLPGFRSAIESPRERAADTLESLVLSFANSSAALNTVNRQCSSSLSTIAQVRRAFAAHLVEV